MLYTFKCDKMHLKPFTNLNTSINFLAQTSFIVAEGKTKALSQGGFKNNVLEK